jgi:hypothetical protein
LSMGLLVLGIRLKSSSEIKTFDMGSCAACTGDRDDHT